MQKEMGCLTDIAGRFSKKNKSQRLSKTQKRAVKFLLFATSWIIIRFNQQKDVIYHQQNWLLELMWGNQLVPGPV